MPSISEANHHQTVVVSSNHDDEDMSSVGTHEIDDILDEAMDDEDEDEQQLHNYSRSPRRMTSAGPPFNESPTSSAASWEFQTPNNAPKVGG